MASVRAPKSLTIEEAFGHILQDLREQQGLKQVEVAVATGYSQRAVGMLERGEKSPTLRTMENFACFYDVPLEELIVRAKQLRSKTPGTLSKVNSRKR